MNCLFRFRQSQPAKNGFWLVFIVALFLYTLLFWSQLSGDPALLLYVTPLLLCNAAFAKRLQSQRVRIVELQTATDHDFLTGVKNRRAYAAMARELENSRGDATVLTCDIDDLKGINDNLGHLAGDIAIRQTGEILLRCSPANAQVFRMGGDEFLLLIPKLLSETECQQLFTLLHRETALAGNLSISFGIAYLNEHCRSMEKALHAADCVMYELRREKGATRRASSLEKLHRA